MIVACYSTNDVARAARLDYWRAVNQSLIDYQPRDEMGFSGSIKLGSLGPVAIGRCSTSPATIERNERHFTRTNGRSFVLMMPVRGRVYVQHYGRQTLLRRGDFTLSDSLESARLWFPETTHLLQLAFDARMLGDRLASPERACGIRMAGSTGLASVFHALLPTVWDQVVEGLDGEIGSDVASSLLDLVVSCYVADHGAKLEGDSHRNARRIVARRFVEARLPDADLDADMVATAMKTSRRYVQGLFREQGETFAGYIQRRRLEECGRRLRASLWAARPVKEIASRWGFNDMGTFSRAFKKQFGESPVDFRRRAEAPSASAPVFASADLISAASAPSGGGISKGERS